ncbi:SDR family oxidoreductase [Streptomyces sp. MZ04]|uniref:SDR family NAD(P)-dependent oxidoreductase n=1 Tax=Streptomyces sp. MZ04 TaxID=2559236 RepID=UPI00107EDDC4|nr:SDR family oxidoreductase [Streptomyces sp. MZ04]TGA86042.1 SDR family oxidoreductase [Streptomyces sp. MZ04]
MPLENKVAVLYGAGGPIGGAVARAFAREGARVHIAGRTGKTLDTLADAIRAQGGVAETGVVDALDEDAVDTYVDGIAAREGRIDISFNVIGYGDVQQPPAERVALDALEGLRRQWACELGPSGVRVVTLKTGGVPESLPEGFPGAAEIAAGLQEATPLPRTATLSDVGDTAAFVASDKARTITSTGINISCGAIVD